MKKESITIIITGPESTGKTTLAADLAQYFKTDFVKEYARTYLDDLEGTYEEEDLLSIAKGQLLLEQKQQNIGHPILIFDTSFLVLKVWSDVKYGRCHPFIEKELKHKKNAFFIVCGTDVEWEYDPLRENENDRDELYQIYKKELLKGGFKFVEITGNREERLLSCIQRIEKEFTLVPPGIK